MSKREWQELREKLMEYVKMFRKNGWVELLLFTEWSIGMGDKKYGG